MKVKTVKRILCVILTVALLMSGTSAFAGDITPRYKGTSAIATDISISGTGKASCMASIVLYSGYTATLTMKLQQYNGSYWTTIQTWSTSDSKSLSKSYYVSSGYSYRVVTSAKVYNSAGTYVEAPSVTSVTKSY